MSFAIVFAPGDLLKVEYRVLRHFQEEPVLCWASRHLKRLCGIHDVYYVICSRTMYSTAHQDLVLQSWALPGKPQRWSIPLDDYKPSASVHPDSYVRKMADLPVGVENLKEHEPTIKNIPGYWSSITLEGFVRDS